MSAQLLSAALGQLLTFAASCDLPDNKKMYDLVDVSHYIHPPLPNRERYKFGKDNPVGHLVIPPSSFDGNNLSGFSWGAIDALLQLKPTMENTIDLFQVRAYLENKL